MNNVKQKIYYIAAFVFCGIMFSATEIIAQCGADGTQPCPKKNVKPIRKPKQPAKPAVKKIKIDTATKARLEKTIAEKANAERQKIEAERLKLKADQAAFEKEKQKREAFRKIAALSANREQTALSIFPVEGVTLGATGSVYMSLTGKNCGFKDANGTLTECYDMDGIYFYCDENKVADLMNVNRLRLKGMPEGWKNQGFDWDLTFKQWNEFFIQKGYQPEITEAPKVVYSEGYEYLSAKMSVIIKDEKKFYRMTLNFQYAFGKTTVEDTGTLFSIGVDKL